MSKDKKRPQVPAATFPKRPNSQVILLPKSTAAQRYRLVEALLSKPGGITTLYARDVLDILHPAGRILELRKSGMNIITHWTKETNQQGRRHRVARYVLILAKQAA